MSVKKDICRLQDIWALLPHESALGNPLSGLLVFLGGSEVGGFEGGLESRDASQLELHIERAVETESDQNGIPLPVPEQIWGGQG